MTITVYSPAMRDDLLQPWGKRGPGALHEALRLPDGRLLTASSGGLSVWDPATGDLLATWTGEPTVALALAPDGTRIAAAGARRAVRVYDLAGAELTRWRRPPGDDDVLLRWDALLIVSSVEGLWGCDPQTGEIRETWDAGSTWMLAAAGGQVLHGSDAGARRFSPGQPKGDKLRAGQVTAVALRPDGYAAVAVGRGLRVYDAAGQEVGRRALPGSITALDIRRDGTVIAGLERGRVAIGEAAPRDLPGWFGHHGDPSAWYFDRDGRHLTVWSGYDGLVEVVDLAAGALLGHVGCFGDASEVIPVTPSTALVHAMYGDGQNTADSGTLFDAGGRCLWRSARGLPPGLIEVDPQRGVVVAAGESLEVIDGRTGASTAIDLPVDDDDFVISVALKRGDIVLELEDSALRLDLERMALVPLKRPRR